MAESGCHLSRSPPVVVAFLADHLVGGEGDEANWVDSVVGGAASGRLLRAKKKAMAGTMAHRVALVRNEPVADSLSEKAIGPAAEASTQRKVNAPWMAPM